MSTGYKAANAKRTSGEAVWLRALLMVGLK